MWQNSSETARLAAACIAFKAYSKLPPSVRFAPHDAWLGNADFAQKAVPMLWLDSVATNDMHPSTTTWWNFRQWLKQCNYFSKTFAKGLFPHTFTGTLMLLGISSSIVLLMLEANFFTKARPFPRRSGMKKWRTRSSFWKTCQRLQRTRIA